MRAFLLYFYYEILVFLIIGLSTSFCFSQNKVIDSLTNILKISKEYTNKVNVLINISKNYISNGELDKGKKSIDVGMVLSKALNYKKGIAVCYQIYGRERSERSDFNGSIDLYNKYLSILNTINIKNELASVYGDLGNAYYLKGNLTKAIEYFLDALKIYELIGDKRNIAGYSGNIGIIYENIHDFNKALYFYNKALKINQEINSQQGIAINYVSIGVVYTHLKKEDEALDYFFKSLKINEMLGSNYYIWNSLFNISSSYKSKKDVINSLLYAKKALDISVKSDDVDSRIRSQHLMANIYKNLGKTQLAEKYLLNNDSLLKAVSSLTIKTQNYLYLSDLYEKTGDYKKSMYYYKASIGIRDSMLNDESNRKIIEQQTQFEFDKKSVADSIKVVEEKKITAIQLNQEKM